MPALTVWGQRLGWLADDDLRVIAQRSFWMRLLQLALLIPSGILLAEMDRMVQEQEVDCSTINTTTSTTTSGTTTSTAMNDNDTYEQDVDQLFRTVWTFWALSLATFVAALGLEGWIWVVAGHGSPVQTEQRRALPGLCAVKLVPLTLLRVAAVIFAVKTVATASDLCSSNDPVAACLDLLLLAVDEENRGLVEDDPMSSTTTTTTTVLGCRANTKPALLALAALHMLEAGVSGLVVGILFLRGACSQGRKRHKQLEQWLSLYSVCNNVLSARRNARGNTAGDGSTSGWWHNCCQFCCLMASCCTCCMFGGSEVVQNSCGCGQQQQQQKSASCLADVSLVLADFFDSTVDDDDKESFLDVAPSDIFVGLRVLATEQSLQMRQRVEQLEQQEAGHDDERGVKISPDRESPNLISSTSLATGFVDLNEDPDLEENMKEEEHTGSDVDSQAPSEKANSGSATARRRRRRFSVQAIRLTRDDSEAIATFSTYERNRLVKENLVDRQAIIEGAHYMSLAQGVYGHIMYLKTHACSAPCCLLAGVVTCRACRCGGGDRPTVMGDNLCRLNELSLIGVANVKVEDVIYCSFQTGVEQCPYAIVVDKAKKTIVLTVRGTLSLEAFATDLSIRPELLDDYRDRCEGLNHPSVAGEYCHSGMLKCAFTIYDDLQKHGILDQLLLSEKARFPDFELVCIGHSLGAGVVAILGIFLRAKFSTLRCLCFAPPGCVLSERAAAQDFITSYVLGVDLVPRLSLHSVEGLRDDVLLMIARIKVPKHVAFRDSRELGLATKDRIQPVSVDSLRKLAYEREGIPESSFYDHLLKFKQRQQKLKAKRALEDVQLSPPGRIVHLVENRLGGGSGYFDFLRQREIRYIPVWADKADFSEIQISRTLIDDHSPDRYDCIKHISHYFASQICDSFTPPHALRQILAIPWNDCGDIRRARKAQLINCTYCVYRQI